MNCIRLSFSELILYTDLLKLLFNTRDDRLTECDCVEAIKNSQIYLTMTGEKVIGFYTVETGEDSVEAHAYILPDKRKHSLSVLRHIIDTYPNITTSVYGTHPHVLKFLLKKGFEITDTLEDALVKNNETHCVGSFFKENIMGGLFGGGSSSTTETSPWKPAQGALEGILGDAGQIYDKNGGLNGNWIDKQLADLTPEMQTAVKDLLSSDQMKQTIGSITQAGQQGVSGIGQATGILGGLANQGITSENINDMAKDLYDTEMVKSQKESMGKDIEQGLNKRVQGINQAAGGSGSMGSSRAGVAEGVATGEAADAYATGSANIENAARTSAYGQAIGTLQGNQNTALNAGQGLGQLGLGSGNMMSGAAGLQNQILQNQLQGAGIGQNQAQNQLNNNWFNQQGQANAGWDNINKYLGIAGSIGGMGGTSTNTGQSGSGLSNAIGLGTAAVGAWNASDASMKKKVKATGKRTKEGHREYKWEWNEGSKKVKTSKKMTKGVLAQEVAKKDPGAVAVNKQQGRLMVDYDKV